MSSKKIIVVFAEGFEEVEALVPVDVLRRLNFNVVMAGLKSELVTGAHSVTVRTDCLLADSGWESADAMMLPGGMPGSVNLRDSDELMDILGKMNSKNAVLAAICAAPIALAKAGLTKNRKVTGYPGSEAGVPNLKYTGSQTEQDGNIITGRGAGASFEFAAKIARALGKTQNETDTLFDRMFVTR